MGLQPTGAVCFGGATVVNDGLAAGLGLGDDCQPTRLSLRATGGDWLQLQRPVSGMLQEILGRLVFELSRLQPPSWWAFLPFLTNCQVVPHRDVMGHRTPGSALYSVTDELGNDAGAVAGEGPAGAAATTSAPAFASPLGSSPEISSSLIVELTNSPI